MPPAVTEAQRSKEFAKIARKTQQKCGRTGPAWARFAGHRTTLTRKPYLYCSGEFSCAIQITRQSSKKPDSDMNFFLTHQPSLLPLFTLFLLTSAQSGGNSCDLKNICKTSLNRETTDSWNAQSWNSLLKSTRPRLDFFNTFIDGFLEQKTAITNMDYVHCLVNSCENEPMKVFKHLVLQLNKISRESKKSNFYNAFTMIEMVMTKRQREDLHFLLKQQAMRSRKPFHIPSRITAENRVFFNGWENGFGSLDEKTFNRQNEELRKIIIKDFLRWPIEHYMDYIISAKDETFSLLRNLCPGGNSLARRALSRRGDWNQSVNLSQNYFGVRFSDCEARKSTCTMRNRVFAVVAQYILETRQSLNSQFLKDVCQ
ncbi:Oidioi.mRNA.OKI2018_I69.chr2.g6523.t1.cds [Oikopleura dioica]|uniref:Oidioi.mRNA.OKI2018_I69.chr2.g6523.t1.cds n=1 Tax=Oikopleura dioica TaxID=34765 RepID=A0ABN7T3B5_OIKDI|nr:Oidioi.mRNA.OKI2018_I69.chr2.g6523.t1.cds [Oikopleura dioica]